MAFSDGRTTPDASRAYDRLAPPRPRGYWSSLEQSVKAQIYLADTADMPDCLDVWSRHYAGIPCAITVVPTKSFATAGGIIEINLIALTNGATRRKEVIDANIPGMAAFGPSLKVGEFLLPSGLMAIRPDGHLVVGALLHLSRKHHLPRAPAIALLQDAMPRRAFRSCTSTTAVAAAWPSCAP
jgi:hypothetical protein